jgi:hypothetical protein
MRETFKKEVIGRFSEEYNLGLTPNPCIECNKYIKFGGLLNNALAEGCNFIATGHYSRIGKAENGRYVLCGKCRCHALLIMEEDAAVQEFEIPFRYASDLPQGATVTDYQATPTVLSCRVRMDGERIHADAEVAISATLMGEKTVQMLTEAAFGDAIAHKACSYTVCYPAREDTLWSVAKRYHQPIEAIATRNALPSAPMADTTASLAGVSYLLV